MQMSDKVSSPDQKNAALMVSRMLLFAKEDLRDLGMPACSVLIEICIKEMKRNFKIRTEELVRGAD